MVPTVAAGIISCMDFTSDGLVLAAGTYAGRVGIFDPRTPPLAQLQLMLHGHRGGLTQVGGAAAGASWARSGLRQVGECCS